MLGSSKLTAFVATANPERAREFYEDVLGLRLVSDDQFATVFDANGTPLRIAKVQELTPAPYTVLGWHVTDIAAVVRGRKERVGRWQAAKESQRVTIRRMSPGVTLARLAGRKPHRKNFLGRARL